MSKTNKPKLYFRGTPRPKVFPITGTSTKDIAQLNNPTHSNNRIYGENGLSPKLNTMQGGRRQPKILLDLNNLVSYQYGEESKLDDRTLEGEKKLRKEEEHLFHLSSEEKNRDTSFERRLARQPIREPCGDLSRMPHQASQEATNMQGRGMPDNQSQIRILREAQPKVQKVRKPTDVQAQPVFPDYCIRRLTVTECERLQGFPDNWTQYDAEGKLVSDTQRYKMMGNAVTTRVVAAIAERLLA